MWLNRVILKQIPFSYQINNWLKILRVLNSCAICKMSKQNEEKAQNKMKIFQTIRSLFASLGIDEPATLSEYKMFTWKNSFVLGFIAMFFVCTVAYTSCDAKTRAEYGDGAYAIVISLANTCILAGINVKAGDCFELVGEFETKIQNRIQTNPKNKAIYEKATMKIEKWTGNIDFYMTKVTPMIMFSVNFISTTIKHFTRGLEHDDYEFPFPAKYAKLTVYSQHVH